MRATIGAIIYWIELCRASRSAICYWGENVMYLPFNSTHKFFRGAISIQQPAISFLPTTVADPLLDRARYGGCVSAKYPSKRWPRFIFKNSI